MINGGTQTDQDSLATTILSDSLTKFYKKKIQFLNISAGSWGPDNCFAYLKKYGDFGAKSIFLFVNSHDAYDNMNFEKIVGSHVSFPSKQYSFALYESFDRYLLPKIKKRLKKTVAETDSLGINKKKDNAPFNSGFNSFAAYSRNKNIQLTIYLHASQNEKKSEAYNEQGQEIIRFANENNIPIIMDLQSGIELSDFRDGIHINCKGQKQLASTIINYIEQQGQMADIWNN